MPRSAVSRAVSRRTAITGSAAAAIGLIGAGVAPPAAGAAGLPTDLPTVPPTQPPTPPPGGPQSPKNSAARAAAAAAAPAALPALAAGEQAYTVFNANLTASTSAAAGSGIVYNGILGGSYPTGGTAWLGTTCQVPVGSLITGVDCTVHGNPRNSSAGVWCDYHQPESTNGFQGTIAQKYFTAGTGLETLSLSINKYYTGKEVYEVYFGGLSSACVARGIRVRYVPPTSGLVPVNTVRLYDSSTVSVGTTPVAVQVAGRVGIPANATAVVVNTEVFAPTAAGYVRVTPYQQDAGVAVQEFARGQAISNLSIVKLSAGKIQVKVSAGKARILMDVSGYFRP